MDVLLPYLQKDKKNQSAEINFSLLKSIGHCEHNYTASVELIAGGLDFLRKLK
jgi:3-dehydroquinate synthetase